MSFPNADISSPPPAQAEVLINQALRALIAASTYGRKEATSNGLTFGYHGGRYNGNTVADGTVSLTPSATNYIVAAKSNGAVSVSTTTTNWNDAANYVRLHVVVTNTIGITDGGWTDYRLDTGGALNPSSVSSVGRHAIWVSATSMQPQATDGCSVLTTVAGATNQPDLHILNFDKALIEYAQFSVAMPKSWNLGTVTFRPIWRHGATTTNFGVVWGLQGVAISDDDPLAATYGTAQSVTDTGGTTNDLYRGPESAAITIAGSPASEDMVFFRVYRAATDGADTLDLDAGLLGIVLYITTNAPNDA